MIPWIMIYTTISIEFATTITLQFDQLTNSSTCEDLTGFLNKTGHTFFELIIMTSGLDTNLKHVLLEEYAKSVFCDSIPNRRIPNDIRCCSAEHADSHHVQRRH